MKRMIIVGAGAAGLMAALSACDRYNVTIIEKNEKAGKKIYITGKGRCNLMNDCDIDTFLKNVVHNSKFMYSSINAFSPQDTYEYFISLGLPMKTERGNRVFPVSDRASDVTKALTDELKRKNVKILYNTTVRKIVTDKCSVSPDEDRMIDIVVRGVETDKGFFPGDVVVVATGGLSYPTTGSTGDGLRFAEESGLKITETFPALCPLNIKEEDCKKMMGLSLKNVKVRFSVKQEGKNKRKLIYEDFGEMLFTHFGVSGPCILSASNYISDYLDKDIKLFIDLKPALSNEELEQRIKKDFDGFRLREFQNSLGQLLPRLMIPVIIERSGISPSKKTADISEKEIRRLAELLKNFELNVIGLRSYNEAIVTRGGVSVKEIDPKTMESKKVKGLRFAGEVLDVDALTGGFNLQIAWSTGHAAGL
ncbi:MAG: NAD(P)/FAD-dependent oxidoreductase [Eubacterium sp.]|nr:NAD(P)/FAD-dependent oxidoreductase [Eubacterium sp.]